MASSNWAHFSRRLWEPWLRDNFRAGSETTRRIQAYFFWPVPLWDSLRASELRKSARPILRRNSKSIFWAICGRMGNVSGKIACCGSAVAGNTYFFFLGALLQFDIVFYGRDVLAVPSSRGSLLQAAIAIGIGLGSLAAGYLSGGKIEYGLIPLGATGITAFGFLLALPGLSFTTVLVLLAALGFFGGFFIVPISALLQHRPEGQHRGERAGQREPVVVCRHFGRVGCLLHLQTFSAPRSGGHFPVGLGRRH